MTLNLSFLGGVGTVTGSKYLVECQGRRILVDCGLFQGFKSLRLKNWEPFPIEPRNIDAVILTHAHLDHSGYLPLLVKRGFTGPVFCSAATADLCEILQEKDAEYANRHGFSKHKPALPLYTARDAEEALKQLTAVSFDKEKSIPGGGRIRLRHAGHILGAATVEFQWADSPFFFPEILADTILLCPALWPLIVRITFLSNRPMATVGTKREIRLRH